MADQPEGKKKRDKFHVLLILIISGLLTLCAVGLIILFCVQKELKAIKTTQSESHNNQIKTNELLLSSMDWATRRQKCILFMRDMIITEWKRIGEDHIDISKAYTYAELIVRNVENFPDIDPFLILAMACTESAFGEQAVSFRGAVGILQVMPYTARPYFEIFGIPYSDSTLYLPANNIRVGIRYFADILASHYKLEKALAIYNCGYAGEYYLDSMVYIPQETREYVPKVLCKWVEYKKMFEEFNVNSLLIKADTIRLDSVRIKNTDLKAKKKPRKKGRYVYRVETD